MISYRTQLLPISHYRPGNRAVEKPDHLKLMDLIIGAAKARARCPSIETVTAKFRLGKRRTEAEHIFDKLVEDGLIHLFRSPYLRAAYVIDLGICTALPRGSRHQSEIDEWYRSLPK